MKYLIDISNIMELRPMAKDIPQERILPFIAETQKFELKQLLGDPLYLDFITNFDNTGYPQYANYQLLLRGTTYAYGVTTIEHPGLIEFIAYFALARFYVNNPINVTKYGIVNKNNDQSTSVDAKLLANAVTELRSLALGYQADVVKYLTTKGALYPLYNYQQGEQLGHQGVDFFDPDDSITYPGQYNGRTLTSF